MGSIIVMAVVGLVLGLLAAFLVLAALGGLIASWGRPRGLVAPRDGRDSVWLGSISRPLGPTWGEAPTFRASTRQERGGAG